MSITALQIIQYILGEWPRLGIYGTADSVQTTGITHAAAFRHSSLGPNTYRDFYIWRYDLTDPQRVKQVADAGLNNATGALTHGAAVYADQSELDYILTGLHPDDWLTALQSAQRRMYEYKMVPFSKFHDGDTLLSGVNYWDSTSGGSAASSCTPTKVTTEGLVYGDNEQSLKLAYSGAGGYCRGEKIVVTPGTTVVTYALVGQITGTVTYAMRNATGSAYLNTGSDVAYSGKDWAYLKRVDTVPEGCYEIQPEFRSTGASDVAYVAGMFGPYEQGMRSAELQQSWLDASFKVILVRPMDFRNSIPGSSNAWQASSAYGSGDMVLDADYNVRISQRAVNPNWIDFRNVPGIDNDLDRPIYLVTRRLASDSEPLSLISSTTTIPLTHGLPFWKQEVAIKCAVLSKGDPFWEGEAAKEGQQAGFETIARQPPARVQPVGMRRHVI